MVQVYYYHSMAGPLVVAGEVFWILREDENVLNKQSRTAGKGWLSGFGTGREAKNSIVKNQQVIESYTGPRILILKYPRS